MQVVLGRSAAARALSKRRNARRLTHGRTHTRRAPAMPGSPRRICNISLFWFWRHGWALISNATAGNLQSTYAIWQIAFAKCPLLDRSETRELWHALQENGHRVKRGRFAVY